MVQSWLVCIALMLLGDAPLQSCPCQPPCCPVLGTLCNDASASCVWRGEACKRWAVNIPHLWPGKLAFTLLGSLLHGFRCNYEPFRRRLVEEMSSCRPSLEQARCGVEVTESYNMTCTLARQDNCLLLCGAGRPL